MIFKDLKKLHQKKYRMRFRHFLVEGEHLILELEKAAKQNPVLNESRIYVTERYSEWTGSLAKTLITEKQMSQISETKSPQGIIACVPFFASGGHSEACSSASPPPRAIYLHQVQDPGNLGTILRTLAWFGNFICLLSPGSVDPYHAKVIRASMGSIFHVPIEVDVPLETLSQRFGRIACLDLEGNPLTDTEFKTCDCYLFGNEARGVPEDQLKPLNPLRFNIGGSGAIESLNLAAAVNMSVYELRRRNPDQSTG